MAEKIFALEILTPKRRVFGGSVTSLIAPGELGYLGIWAHHAPLMTTLVPGRVTYRGEGGTLGTLTLQGAGFLTVHQNTATILADEVEET